MEKCTLEVGDAQATRKAWNAVEKSSCLRRWTDKLFEGRLGGPLFEGRIVR